MMDMFAELVPIQHKERIHFNEFMLRVHNDLHKLDQVHNLSKYLKWLIEYI